MIRELCCADLVAVNKLLAYFASKPVICASDLNHPFYRFLVYTVENAIVGVMMYEIKYDNMEIDYIIVDKMFRSKKIASMLLEKLMEIALLNKIKNITLEVRISNETAINLYKKFGFEEIVIRKNYYDSEDAILMLKKVNL